jgi:hypothetical protein
MGVPFSRQGLPSTAVHVRKGTRIAAKFISAAQMCVFALVHVRKGAQAMTTVNDAVNDAVND